MIVIPTNPPNEQGLGLRNINWFRKKMVPRERIELSASPLPRVRSTTELPRLISCESASIAELIVDEKA